MRRVHVTVPVRADQQQALDRLLAQHQVDEAERGAPRPLQVIQEYHDRPFLRGDRPQRRRGRPLHPGLRGQRIPRLRRHPQQCRELRQHRGQQARARPRRRHDLVAEPRQLTIRLGQQQSAQRPERLVSRVELQVPAVGVELAGHEPAVTAGHRRPQLVDQRRLAHPGRPVHQHPAALARRRAGERGLQRRYLLLAPGQPRQRQQPHRDITLADPEHSRWRICARRPPHAPTAIGRAGLS